MSVETGTTKVEVRKGPGGELIEMTGEAANFHLEYYDGADGVTLSVSTQGGEGWMIDIYATGERGEVTMDITHERRKV